MMNRCRPVAMATALQRRTSLLSYPYKIMKATSSITLMVLLQAMAALSIQRRQEERLPGLLIHGSE